MPRFELDFPGKWILPHTSRQKGLMIYVPGGSFAVGPSPLVIALMTRIAQQASLALFMPQVRLAPEHNCPAPIHDLVSLFEQTRGQAAMKGRIILAAEQTGANLCLAAFQQDSIKNKRLFAAMLFFSPWLDLTLTTWSAMTVQMGKINVHSRDRAEWAVRFYLGMENPELKASHPLASPLFGPLGHLPPLMIHACESDLTLDDAKVLCEKLEIDYPQTELHIWPRVARMWQRYELDYCLQSIIQSVAFLRKHLPG